MIKCHLNITPSKECYDVCVQSRRCEALKMWENKADRMTNEQAINELKDWKTAFSRMDKDMSYAIEAFDMAIKALNCSEFPNESDTIYRQDAIDFIQSLYPSAPIMRWGRELWKEKYKTYIEIEKALEMLPSATKLEAKELQDVKVERDYWKQKAKYAERPKGEWIDLDEYQTMDWMSKNKCSICGKITFGELKNYCPHCGADMKGKG